MSRNFILVLVILIVLGLSSAVVAGNGMSFSELGQKKFSDLAFDKQQEWAIDFEGRAEIIQKGDNNSALIKQKGNYNRALITQTGNSNSALIKQLSDNNTALIKQLGSNNQAVIIQN